ncbi:glycosyltransferase 61 family protein [Geodermatophilus sp. SYSU D01180]
MSVLWGKAGLRLRALLHLAGRLVRATVRVATHDPRLLLARPEITLLRARVVGKACPSRLSGSEATGILDPRVSLHRDVISVPLTAGRDRDLRGGLVHGDSHRLIDPAVLRSGSEWRQEEPVDELLTMDLERMRELKVPVLYGGVLFTHFGHFLLESLGRLWAYEHLRPLDPYIAFHEGFGKVDWSDERTVAHQVLRGLGIPLDRVLLLSQPVRLAHVFVPSQLYGYGFSRNPPQTFVEHMRRFRFTRSVPSDFTGARRVYISRSGLPDRYGRPMGETLFEDYLRGQGYAVLHPERYPLHEQLSVYEAADELVFCDGAALHGCVLLPDLTARVAVISRRHDPRWDGSGIVDQFKGYGQDVTWIDAVRYQYQFGLESWDARSFVDWYDVSNTLMERGFTDTAFDAFRAVDTAELVMSEVHDYVDAIRDDPRFFRFMTEFRTEAVDHPTRSGSTGTPPRG